MTLVSNWIKKKTAIIGFVAWWLTTCLALLPNTRVLGIANYIDFLFPTK